MTWTPNSTGQYTGTCVFLIALAAIFRALLAVRVHFYPLLAAADIRHNGGINYQHFGKSGQGRWRVREATLLGLADVIIAGVGYMLYVFLPNSRQTTDKLTMS